MRYKYLLTILCLTFLTACNLAHQKNVNSTVEKKDSKVLTSPIDVYQADKRFPLMVSNDFGETWKSASENLPEDLEVSFIEQKGNELVLASDNSGVFISTQNLNQWKPIGFMLPDRKINALDVDADDIYVGVYRHGIYRTTNSGDSWQSLNYDLRNLNVQCIHSTGDDLLVGTDIGVFILDEQEKRWKETKLKAQVLSLYDYDDKLVAGTSQGTFISNNSGEDWEWIRKEGAVHYTHNIGKRIIELVLDGDVFYSDDWGENWEPTHYEPREGSYVYEIIESGANQIMSNNYGVHRSMDQGKTWEHIFKTESMVFFDLISIGSTIYGGTRSWNEYRGK